MQAEPDMGQGYQDINQRNKQKEASIYYKSKLCIHWQQKGMCAKGENCNFAHGEHELRNIQPPEYLSSQSTKNTTNQFTLNNESAGNIANVMQMSMQGQLLNPFWKTKMCNFYLQGKCRNVIDCNYAHSEEELRDPEQQAAQSMANLVQLQNPEYRTMLIHYNATFQKNLLERAKIIYEQIRRLQNIHAQNQQIQDVLEDAKLLVFQQELEQATLQALDVMESAETTHEDRLQYIDIKNRIKESFEQPQIQVPQMQQYFGDPQMQNGGMPMPMPSLSSLPMMQMPGMESFQFQQFK